MLLTNMSDTAKTAALFSSIPDVVTRFGNNLQFGENGNTEYSWSSYFQEKLKAFFKLHEPLILRS